MGIYAREPRRRVAQVAGDLLVLGWGLAWWLLSRVASSAVLALAAPARQTATTAGKISGSFRNASGQADRVPGIGNELRQPFDAAAGSFTDLVGAANQQVANIERLAQLTGWLVFLVPVLLLLVPWLPRRVADVLRSRAGQRYVDSGAALDLFALRALASQPTHLLAALGPDPAGAWRSGDATVISKLAEVELRRSGLRAPAPGREAVAPGERHN
jgi:hypothetical protein